VSALSARVLVLTIGAIVSSCSPTLDECRSLGLDSGYHTIPLHLSWSGVATDNPNFTKLNCDLPLQNAIVSHDTIKALDAMKEVGDLPEGRSSFETRVDAFLYQSGDEADAKTFIIRLDFGGENVQD